MLSFILVLNVELHLLNYCNEMETFSSRGKLLIHLALQKPNKCFHEYKKSEYMIGSRTEEIGTFEIEHQHVENTKLKTAMSRKTIHTPATPPKYASVSTVIQNLFEKSHILTPPKSRKRIILDTPDGTTTDKREKRKMSNGAASVVKTLYNDITNILNTYDDLAHPFDDDVCDDVFAEVPDDTQVVSFSDDILMLVMILESFMLITMWKSLMVAIIFKLESLMLAMMFKLII